MSLNLNQRLEEQALLELLIAAQYTAGEGRKRFKAADFYRAYQLNDSAAIKLMLSELTGVQLQQAQRILNQSLAAGLDISWFGQDNYPASFKKLHTPPLVLFSKGSALGLIQRPIVGIVGTRKASAYGRRIAFELGKQLAERGCFVVSGFAFGIDAEAHRGVLASSQPNKVIAVIPSGLDAVYPRQHENLSQQVMHAGGILISELPAGFPSRVHYFLQRNRLIAALADVLVVVEAPIRSGALATARLALELGQDVYCVPGQITSPSSAGTNAMLAEGAGIIHDLQEFLSAWGGVESKMPAMEHNAEIKALLRILDQEAQLSFESLSSHLTLDLAGLQALLMEAELAGLIEFDFNDQVRLARG